MPATGRVEGGHGPELKVDILYLTNTLPVTLGWPDFSIDWGGTIVDYAAGTVACAIGTNAVYALDDGTIVASLAGFPSTPHKKLAEFVCDNFGGNARYVSHTWFGPLLFVGHVPSSGGADPVDLVTGILYDVGTPANDLGFNAFQTREGVVINSIAAGTLAGLSNATHYIEVVGTTVSENTVGYTRGRIPLGIVIVAGGDITSLTEETPVLARESSLLFTTGISGDTTLTDADIVVLCDASGGDIVVTLPAVAARDGRRYFIKKIDGSGNIVTIDGNGAETIDDSLTKVISTQYDSLEIVCDGSEWWII